MQVGLSTILVTGANGFIGRTLCKRMLVDGYQVRGTVRSATQKMVLPSRVEMVPVGNIHPQTDWSKALFGIDTIVHLAARVHVLHKNNVDAFSIFKKINVDGTMGLAQQAAEIGIKRLIYISSVKVNGEDTEVRNQKSEIRGQKGELKGAFSEMDIPEPRDPYGISKWEAEKVLNKISEETGMEIVILRSPLVYGPKVKANFLRLLKVLEHGIPLPLASVNNRRSLIYLGNLVDAIITCIKKPKASGQTYFVSDGEDVSTPEFIRRISSALGKPARLFPFPPVMLKLAGIITGKSVEMNKLLGSLTVDCSKIRRELDWQAPFSMEQGLRETATWYLKRKNISRPSAIYRTHGVNKGAPEK